MEEQLVDYLHYLQIERGLSNNTRRSYERDLKIRSLFTRTRPAFLGRS